MTFIVPPISSGSGATPFRPLARSGVQYAVSPGALPTASVVGAANTLYLLPFYLVDGETLASFAIRNISGGPSTVRLGIYENDGFGRPGEQLDDFGTVAVANATTGTLAANFPAPFSGWFYIAYTATQFTQSAQVFWPWAPTIVSGLSRIGGGIIAGTAGATLPANPLPLDLTGSTLTLGGTQPALNWVAG